MDPGSPLQRDFESAVERDPASVPLVERLAMARERMRRAIELDPLVANAVSILGHTVSEDVFVNRTRAMSQKILRSDSILVVFVSRDGKTVDVHNGSSKNAGLESTGLSDDELRRMVDDAKRLLDAPRLEPGLYDVVTDPEWSGIIAHECFGHGMETDLYVRQRALSQRYIGKPVASTIVNMYDDPSLIGESGGFFFDDEGQIAVGTHIIKDGILQRGLTDLASAHKLGLPRSANGRRESFARKAYARMTNTFFESGAHTPEQIIGSVEDGLYLRHATNGMEDPQAWGIQVEGLWAERIRGGKLTGEVFSPVIMTGFVPDLLMSISMVGNDRKISGLGMCGKGHKEWVKNTTGGPHLRMKARLA
jgi:TldD protein